ncbi:DUF6578 domain-containing protein [Streptomyces pseudovenezuelae]|uniref:Uncharacterized protein n=1 Tax=Streptomyces pseudovenezuelae TaxID=67350 RepID=A0ABT6LKR9_9ACTN|nr:DUF6578 domain-containing protein [Streptomyces pseudovenezuelae]MDH6216565.1 hypothetical protein [Streptomyces pseudovenezuelae]
MGFWEVFYASWQMECCGTPFSVGEEVSWPLMFSSSGELLDGGWHEELAKLVGPVERLPGRSLRFLREESGLTVALGGDLGAEAVSEDGSIRLVGMLLVERHGSDWPQAGGKVGAVRVVTQEYEEKVPGSRSWTPVREPGARRLRSVDTCPKWFERGTVDERGRRAMEEGVLVTLEVPSGAPEGTADAADGAADAAGGSPRPAVP